jgi:uncharacterized protein (TIGR02145 family)
MKKRHLLIASVVIAAIIYACAEEETIEKPPEIILQAEISNTSSYNGSDGSIDLSVTGGLEPFHYFWSTGDTTQDITGVRAGTYIVKIIFGPSGEGVAEEEFIVGQPEPDPLNLDFSTTEPSRFGEPDGRISLEVSGGSAPYSYLWSTGDTLPEIRNLTAGDYFVTVTDKSKPDPVTTVGRTTLLQPDFVCGVDSIYDVDGIKYSTVQIGDQCWLGENLRTRHNPLYPDSLVPISGRFCFDTYCNDARGAHYSWTAMMNGQPGATLENPDVVIQGICPSGWHVPTRKEWDELQNYLTVDGNGGSGTFAGAKMKTVSSTSGFDALLIGNWGYGIYNKAPQASFWSADIYQIEGEEDEDTGEARLIYLTDDTPFMNGAHRNKELGLSVRCVRDIDSTE